MADVPAFACRHNVAYWMGHDFYGCGPSASEYVDGVRSRNWANTVMYCEQLERGRRSKEFAEALGPLARAGDDTGGTEAPASAFGAAAEALSVSEVLLSTPLPELPA